MWEDLYDSKKNSLLLVWKKALPDKAKKCISSWKKFCPDYEIVEWNEDNFDIYQNPYTIYTYKNNKYAF